MAVTLLPTMTSNIAPAPYVASASAGYNPAWYAFDKNNSSYWLPSPGTLTGWVAIDLGSAKTANTYRITPGGSIYRAPKTWTLQGSTDGTTWTTLDTQTGVAWPSMAMQEFTVATPGNYRHYRLNITANNGDTTYLAVAEFDLLGAGGDTTGTLAGSLPALAGSMAASAPVAGSLAGTLPKLVGSVATTYTPPPPQGTLGGSLPALAGSMVAEAPVAGPLAGTLPPLVGAISAESRTFVETSTEYANYGYGYVGLGEVDYEPSIAVSSARIRPTKIRRAHQSIPAPTLVDGRPV